MTPRISPRLHETFSSGISLTLVEYHVDSLKSLDFIGPEDAVGCCFCLRGSLNSRVPGSGFTSSISDGVSGVWYAPNITVRTCFQPGDHLWLEMTARKDFILRLLDDHQETMCPEFRKSIATGAIFHRSGPFSANTRLVVEQIIGCTYVGGLRRHYLETKAVELILDELNRHTLRQCARGATCSCNRNKVDEAWRLLTEHIDNPPTLEQIARSVAMSPSTLKRSFRRVYGDSIFSRFQAYRLELARALLKQGDYNVTEVAFRVGYTNHSHFSRAFRREFGVAPKAYLLGSPLFADHS